MTKSNFNELDEPLMPEALKEKEPTDKAKRIKKLLIISIPIVIVILAITYFFFFVIKAPKISNLNPTPQSKEKQQVVLEQNTYLDMDPITVGLTSVGAKREYLRLDLTIRLASEQENAAVMSKLPIIKDSLITFLRSLRSTDFNSSSSSIYLKEEIAKRINKITAPIVVKEVLFQEIMIN